jgi:hypothetical protein
MAMGGALISGYGEAKKNKAEQGGKQKKGGGKKKLAVKAAKAYFGMKKNGGPIRKTGLYTLHKGEYVETAKKARKKRGHRSKVGKRSGMHKLGQSPPIKKTGLKRGAKKRQYGNHAKRS